jgi:hypothetical protein
MTRPHDLMPDPRRGVHDRCGPPAGDSAPSAEIDTPLDRIEARLELREGV